jgi:Condensation domain/AMP-binding enzyme/Phosphopantetheine attachment site/AMP-binding enzyme C-terminal domain
VVIGPPIANTTFHLLGEDSQPVRAGEPGELCIGGDGLARGYLNRPELTAQRFVSDPFSREPGARLYKTGDLARQIPDGNFEFLGRRDHQVKIRGFRIELGEIETVLRGHPAVRDAVVVAHDAAPGDTRLVAYVTAANSHRPAPAEMRRFLEAKLPRYMVPVAFTELPSFPLTPNGKLDRKALPVPDPGHMESAENHVAPRNTAEEKLAAIWSDVLGVSGIGVNDDFFELGGHSLLATRVVSRVRDVFNVEASVRDLFEAPTIGGFARRVIDARAAEAGGAPPILPVPRDGSLPASFAQERLWFLDQMEASRAVYNMPAKIRIAGALQPAVLRRCMAEVLRRHESLRTNFEAIDGRPAQVIRPPAEFDLPLIDLCGMREEQREIEIARSCAEEAARPFDLSREPLLQARLFRLGEKEHVLFLNVHHIAFDDWSMALLLRECGELYRAYCDGRESPLPEPAIQYADFAVWQRNWLQSEVLAERLDYWRRQLDGAPALLALPADRPRPAAQSYRGATESVVFPEPLFSGLKALAQREGASIFMTLLAAFEVLLHRWTGAEDLVVGTARRPRE